MNILIVCNYKPGVGGISGQVELLQKHLREEGHVADIFSTKGSFLGRLGLPLRLRKTLKAYSVVPIHCCSGFGFMPAVVGVTVGRWLKKRVVLTYHGGGGESFFGKHRFLVRYYLNNTDANIVLSRFLALAFEKYHLPYTIIPNIIELDECHYRERNEITPNFICIRTHEPLYNIPCILRAFKKVLTELPEATLTLVGDGSQHPKLMQMTEELGIKSVNFTGKVDNKDIYKYLDKADVMLSTPMVDNMPVSLLEAMNAGLLVISSNVGGVPYMIDDGRTGLLCESDNDCQLAERILWAMNHPEKSISIIHEAHTEEADDCWDTIRKKIYIIYGDEAL